MSRFANALQRATQPIAVALAGHRWFPGPRILEPIEAAVLAKPFFRFIVRRMPGAITLTLS